jgi:hypothetical protein
VDPPRRGVELQIIASPGSTCRSRARAR